MPNDHEESEPRTGPPGSPKRTIARHDDLVHQLSEALLHTHDATKIRALAGDLLQLMTERDRIAEANALAEAHCRDSEDRYRTLLNSIDEGFCIIEMIHDEQGKPIDYLFIEVNHIFEKQTGLRDVVGKKVSQLSAPTEEYWLQNYDNVARTGSPCVLRTTMRVPRAGTWPTPPGWAMPGANR